MTQERAGDPGRARTRTRAGRRVLLLGRSPAALESLLADLAALEVAASASAEPESAVGAFDPATFSLLALDRGIEPETRAALAEAFRAANPAIAVRQTDPLVAVPQILAALDGLDDKPAVDLQAYCARIGYRGPLAPTLAVLEALHERHPAAIVFEALDVLLGRGVDLAPAAVDAKLIGSRRGGYCFEQNGLFRRVLEAVGFEVQGLAARVRWLQPPHKPPMARTHMALQVTLGGSPWLVDVGFGGCVLSEPLRLDSTAPQPTRHDVFRLIPFGDSRLLQVGRKGRWLPLYELSLEPHFQGDYEAANWFTSTHPASPFRQGLRVARTTPEARHGLMANRYTLRRPDGRDERRDLDADGIEAVLREVFELPVERSWRPLFEQAARR